jgi:RHS repeat-associated protein
LIYMTDVHKRDVFFSDARDRVHQVSAQDVAVGLNPGLCLVYMRHRIYGPRLGRFTQSDPIQGSRSSKR